MNTDAEKAIADQWAGFRDALLPIDYDSWASHWTQDAWILEPGMNLKGRDLFDTVRDMIASDIQILSWSQEVFETLVHGDVAYQIGQYDESIQFPGEEQAVTHEYYFFARWEKEGGVWKLARLMSGPRDAPSEG